MKRGIAVLITNLLLVAVLAPFSPATGGKSTVSIQPDGSVTIVGYIQKSQQPKGFVVQAKAPKGAHGEYFITNPHGPTLSALAEQGEAVKVEGKLKEGAFLLKVIAIDGQPYP